MSEFPQTLIKSTSFKLSKLPERVNVSRAVVLKMQLNLRIHGWEIKSKQSYISPFLGVFLINFANMENSEYLAIKRLTEK